ncbi:type II toxin-antitoxin system RelE/ParE family toxin [Candidatus Kaiserbacteria bacterium]|nr:type II toxin-antitoxin system RelE/ParE family toxin [Candidatus Kaiserbacteria bacterium]
MNVEYSKRALADLRRIAEYHLQSDIPSVADHIAKGIQEVVERLPRSPKQGRSVSERPGVRVALLLQYRYKIFYRATEKTIRIVHIRHTSRQPWED